MFKNPLGKGTELCRKGEEMKKTALTVAAALSVLLAFTGCGRANNNTNTNGGMTTSASTTSQQQNSTAGSQNGGTNNNTTNNNANGSESTRTTGDIDGDGFIEDVVTEAGDIVNDVVTGAEDIVDDVF